MREDCDHATSIADVSGTLSGELIAGLKETAYCRGTWAWPWAAR